MLAWYQIVFDAKVQYQNPVLAFLTYDDEHHRFAFACLAVLQPDGNQMEFQVDSFGSSDEANAFMCGPINAANPIGVEYDPEEWLARMRAAAPPSIKEVGSYETRSTCDAWVDRRSCCRR